MWRVTVGTADIVAPVFPTSEIVVFFFAGMAGETGLGSFFGRFIFEGNDLGRISCLNMGLAWSMARLAASYLSFPTAGRGKLGM